MPGPEAGIGFKSRGSKPTAGIEQEGIEFEFKRQEGIEFEFKGSKFTAGSGGIPKPGVPEFEAGIGFEFKGQEPTTGTEQEGTGFEFKGPKSTAGSGVSSEM